MLFWIVAGALGVAVAGLLVGAVLRRPADAGAAGEADLRVYRDQLDEVERDVARGTLGPAEAERLRTEVARRVLAADREGAAAKAGAAPRWASVALCGFVAAAMLGAVWSYQQLGAPGYPDMPVAARLAAADDAYRNRPGQAEAVAAARADRAPAPAPDAEFAALMARLREAVAERPDDLRGQQLLARNEAMLGNFDAAIAAQRRVIALKAPAAEDAAALAELMVLAAGGYVSPEAEAELVQALRLDPGNGTATYYAGLMFLQTGRPDRTFDLWAPLLERSAPDAAWVAPIRAGIERVAAEAGIGYTLPALPEMPGPTSDDIAAASALPEAERREMIEGMVARLGARLADEGGPAPDWAQLIRALGVLGDTAQARKIYAEAEIRFRDRAEDLAAVRAAAEAAGVAE